MQPEGKLIGKWSQEAEYTKSPALSAPGFTISWEEIYPSITRR
jgi:hypothetical protein